MLRLHLFLTSHRSSGDNVIPTRKLSSFSIFNRITEMPGLELENMYFFFLFTFSFRNLSFSFVLQNKIFNQLNQMEFIGLNEWRNRFEIEFSVASFFLFHVFIKLCKECLFICLFATMSAHGFWTIFIFVSSSSSTSTTTSTTFHRHFGNWNRNLIRTKTIPLMWANEWVTCSVCIVALFSNNNKNETVEKLLSILKRSLLKKKRNRKQNRKVIL